MATYWSDMCDKPTCLYRIYDADERLLYVGISNNLDGRMSKHRRRDWWRDARYMEVRWFDDRTSALSAERHAIRDEDPIYNVTRPRLECC